MYTVSTDVDLLMNILLALPQYSFWYVESISLLQNQLDSFQVLAIVSVNYAVAMHCTPCQIRYTTKWVKLESIHDKTSFSSSKSYFPPPTSLYWQEEWCWEFWKQSASPNEKVKWHQRTKQEAGRLWNYHWAEGRIRG